MHLTKTKKRVLLSTGATLLFVALLFAGIFLWYGTVPDNLFYRYYVLETCSQCGLKVHQRHVAILGLRSRTVAPIGRSYVHAILQPNAENCSHQYETVGRSIISLRIRGLKLQRNSMGKFTDDSFYEKRVLGDALAPIARTNSALAAEIFGRLNQMRAHGTIPSDVEIALDRTNATLLAELLMKKVRRQPPR